MKSEETFYSVQCGVNENIYFLLFTSHFLLLKDRHASLATLDSLFIRALGMLMSDLFGLTQNRISAKIFEPGGVAQEVRACGSYPQCRGFDSLHRHSFH